MIPLLLRTVRELESLYCVSVAMEIENTCARFCDHVVDWIANDGRSRKTYPECIAQDLERWGRWPFSECGEEFPAPRLLARAAGNLPHQGDEPYTADPPPVAGTWCMLLLLARSGGERLVHTCMSSAMRFPYELTENSLRYWFLGKLGGTSAIHGNMQPSVLVFQHLGYYLKGHVFFWLCGEFEQNQFF